jgi:hypothetical protein
LGYDSIWSEKENLSLSDLRTEQGSRNSDGSKVRKTGLATRPHLSDMFDIEHQQKCWNADKGNKKETQGGRLMMPRHTKKNTWGYFS